MNFEEDLHSAPMEPCHKALVLHHHRRLTQIIHEHNEAAIGTYTNKQAAREQLARMTLVVRDYKVREQSRDEEEEEEEEEEDTIESMIADVLDAAFFLEGTQASYHNPLFTTPWLWGRSQEVAAIMQELSANSADDVIELWNVLPPKDKCSKVVPDSRPAHVDDIGADVDWNDVLCRSRSESNLVWLAGREGAGGGGVEDREEWEVSLLRRELEQLDLAWPPVFRDPEPNVGRQRERTGAGSRVTSTVVSRRGSMVGI